MRKRIHHGFSKMPEYKVWKTMRQRCLNPKNQDFPRYGGRGIAVCERWSTFPPFLADMGRRPDGKMWIERRDNHGNYEPSNCCWATPEDQGKNQRKRSTNSSGVTGVHWDEERRKWRVQGHINKKKKMLGDFDDLPAAIAARKAHETAIGWRGE